MTGIVKPEGLGKPDSRLRVQMKKLQFTSRLGKARNLHSINIFAYSQAITV